LKINFRLSIEALKAKFLDEQEKRKAVEDKLKRVVEEGIEALSPSENVETQEGWGVPRFPTLQPGATLGIEPLPDRVTVTKEVTRMVREPATKEFPIKYGPPPKKCLRSLSFTHATDDSYCHHTCMKGHPKEYQACRELKQEHPELFR